ncbi:hypothetical protein V1504DRAFT_449293 [Lipomyces starkeyi]
MSRVQVRVDPSWRVDSRIRLDIEQAWDVNASARWGQAFTNTVKSIYIPMTSEMSDTVNRTFGFIRLNTG